MRLNIFQIPLALLILSISLHSYATMIDFEGATGTANNIGEYIDVGDYRFTLSGGTSFGFEVITGLDQIIEPSTTKLFSGNHSEITMSRIDGAAFDLLSLDIAGSWINLPDRWADHVDLIAGNNIFTAILEGMPPSYQSITPNFLGVTSVLFKPFVNNNDGPNNYEFVLDNLLVSTTAVPEPPLLALLSIGVIGMVMFRKRRIN